MVEKEAQTWLDNWTKDNYKSDKTSVTEIKFDGVSNNIELKGEIKFEGYNKLETLELVSTKELTKVTFINCSAIRKINIYGNVITEIDGLDGLTELTDLNCGGNRLAKVDLSKNAKLVTFRYHENPQLKGEEIKGLGNLTKIVRITGGNGASDGIALNLSSISKEELENVAKELNIDTQGRDASGIRDLIKDRGKRDRDNTQKLNDATTGLPNLLNTKGEVDDSELRKINEDQKEIKGLHDVANHTNNARILENGRLSQTKLDAELAKSENYNELLKNPDNKDLIENDKISQDKINGIRNANKNAADAIDRLGVPDLKVNPTLEDILGPGTKLSDIPTKTGLKDLKSLIEEIERLKNDSSKLKATEQEIRSNEGDKYWADIEARVLIVVNKPQN